MKNVSSKKQKQRLEMINKSKNISKFWEYKRMDDEVAVVRYGRINSYAKTIFYSIPHLEMKIKEKLRKGYKPTKKKVA